MSFDLLSERKFTARKNHECIWCNEDIKSEERYVSQAVIYDGDFSFRRFHEECLTAYEQFFSENKDETEFSPHECKRGSLEHR